ncbi:MAG: ribonuclease H-like domain-containing protein [Candidatus Dormibacteria bacterium]
MVLGIEERRAQIDSLRARISALGGLGAPRSPNSDGQAWPRPSPTRRPPASELQLDSAERAAALGFAAERAAGGTAFVRRVSVGLRPLLNGAGLEAAPGPEGLLGLGCRLPPEGRVTTPAEEEVVVLDIETLGLRGSGVLAFLVGLGTPAGDRLEVEQLLLADPEGETALLSALISRLRRRRLIVTYNGRCFDVPALVARCVVNRLPPAGLEDPLHADLLGPVRRLFRDRLGVCTLRQAEGGLLGYEREGDVPGCEAPARYRTWLRSGCAALLRGVVVHNELDLCTTMVLGSRLAAHVGGHLVKPIHPADRYNLGRFLDAEHHLREALEAGEEPWSRRAGHHLARRLARRSPSERMEAVEIWQGLWNTRATDLRAARAVAVGRERAGDLNAALAVCRRVQRLCSPDSPVAGVQRRHPASLWTGEWQRRCARLERRVESRRVRHPGTTPESPPGGQQSGHLETRRRRVDGGRFPHSVTLSGGQRSVHL